MIVNKIVLVVMLAFGAMYAQADESKLTAELHGSKGNTIAAIDEMMTKKLSESGFHIVQANKDIQNFYYQKFKEKMYSRSLFMISQM